jgi:hypothetical protein
LLSPYYSQQLEHSASKATMTKKMTKMTKTMPPARDLALMMMTMTKALVVKMTEATVPAVATMPQ